MGLRYQHIDAMLATILERLVETDLHVMQHRHLSLGHPVPLPCIRLRRWSPSFRVYVEDQVSVIEARVVQHLLVISKLLAND